VVNQTNNERLFGTDGIRGTPGIYPLTDGMIFKIGVSIAKVITYKNRDSDVTPCLIIGRDTRLTGRRIESILSDAISFYGIDIHIAGTITTPGLSFLVKDIGANMGIMISASHNKATDNGIKFFNEKGFKLSTEEEEWIEKIIFSSLIHTPNGVGKKQLGQTFHLGDAQEKYAKFLTSSIEGMDLKGMRIALDCGWGAASGFGTKLLKDLGAQVIAINDKPSGENINEGGAVDPKSLRELVLESNVNIGVAVDGDGDRSILIDEKGRILDGDHILAIAGKFLIENNKLNKNTVVGTVMSNLGLKVYLKEHGAEIITTKVGDKHVLEALIRDDLVLGGEQSGHIIFFEHLPAPDGLLTALQILKVMKKTGKKLSELIDGMTKFPQILVNVKVKERKPFEEIEFFSEKLDYFSDQLKSEGRILLRYSGTENLARVMVEGKDKELITKIAHSLADIIREGIGTRLEDIEQTV